jgi:hypothetical protein
MRLFVVCVLATMTGCSFFVALQQPRPPRSCAPRDAAAAFDLLAGAGLLAATASASASGSDADPPSIGTVMGLGLTSLLLLKTGLAGAEASAECHVYLSDRDRRAREDARAEALLQQRIAVREQAWKLTVDAEAAARAGDCTRVAELDPKIATIDIEMHDTVFARDVAVARCRSSGAIR